MDLSLFRGGLRRTNIFNPFSLDIRNPFEGFPLADVLSSSETSAIANTRIDQKETPEAHVFKSDLPGLRREEVKVEVEEGRILKISGERSTVQKKNNGMWHRVETRVGKFVRRFELPENVRLDQIQASMENGVLTVIVPKEQHNDPEVKHIEIS